MDFDYIIVGGGSAGCVLAGRLSARSANRVLLLEAGRDYPPGTEPDGILDLYTVRAVRDRRNMWPDIWVSASAGERSAAGANRRMRYEQARIIGGASSINGLTANRGVPDDYDAWEAKGARGWGWAGVLPYFIKLERDLDFSGPLHGRDGPIPIRRFFPELWPGFSRAAAAAFAAEGYAYIADQNGSFEDGYVAIPMCIDGERRVSSAMGYLDAAARRRPNLVIRGESPVRRLLTEGRRVVGVEVAGGDGPPEAIRAGEVIVCAGALHSPALLLRAGIGPAAHLAEMGIPVVADLAGVGRHLQDHPAVAVGTYLRPEARIRPPMRRQFFTLLRYSSGVPGCEGGDMLLTVINRTAWHPLGLRFGAIIVCLNRPYATGSVTLASPDPRVEPRIAFNLLADERDLARVVDGVRRAARGLRHPALAACADAPFPTFFNERVRSLNAYTWGNWIKTGVFALMLDALPALRGRLIERFVTRGVTLDRLLADEAALAGWARDNTGGVWHASCTCRMGAADDPLAVLDPACRVRGVAGLRVVDASAMPEVPRANICVPIMMMAEKVADTILAGD